MNRFLIDENLPYFFKLWKSEEFTHVFDLKKSMSDSDIWKFAKENNMVIVTKDADFSNRIMLESPPPKIIHTKIGNLKIQELYTFLNALWPTIIGLLENSNLITVYNDRIESIAQIGDE